MSKVFDPATQTDAEVGVQKYDTGLTWRSLVLSLVLTVLCGWWVRQAEIVVLSTQITESVPAIPGLAALILLLGVNVVLRRWGRLRPLTRGELLIVFLFVTISTTVLGCGIQRFFLALITAPFYFEQGGISAVRKYLPGWLVPNDPLIIKQLYEGSPGGVVPWKAWLVPALAWLGFFLALWWAMYCLMALVYRAWSEEERLPFPLAVLPLEMAGGESRSLGAKFFRNPVMWLGFGVAAVFNAVNILHAFQPWFPSIPRGVDLGEGIRTPPWTAILPIGISFRPEMIGLGYLVSTEISLSVWLFFILHRVAAMIGMMAGYPSGEMPYPQEQGIGAYVVLALFLLWLARRQLMRAVRLAWQGEPDAGKRPEGISYRAAFLGLIGGFTAVCLFCRVAGMSLWVIAVYLGIVLMVALVYARVRGEAGAPLVWLFPFYMQKNVLLYTFGSRPFAAAGPAGTLTLFAMLTFLARGYFPSMIGYQVEGMEITRRAHILPRALVITVVLALVAGFAIGWYNHLVPYYQHGAQQLRGGIWGWEGAVQEYTWALQYPTTPKLPEPDRITATAIGGGVALALAILRLRFVWFPLHPLGYAMTCSYGGLVWSPFFIVWVLKSLALRYGGMDFYRRTIPFFLGLALGHYAMAGVLWGLIGVWSQDALHGYPVFFG
ncbi:MAG: hypothetical protein HY320_04545 [Armatimonadetes bacterium]|nr:hypothetical protein [Armatimonadota bacterium]